MKICLLPVPVVASRKTANAPQARRRTLGLSALLTLAAATTAAAAPAKAVTSCQAINASSLLPPTPTAPSPACTTPVAIGDTFEIDFSTVFGTDSASFSVDNTYSLQIANINNGLPSSLSFSNVELLVTGAIGPTSFTDQAINIWQASGQTGQGITNYTTNGTGQLFNGNLAFKSANFTLTGPQSFSTFGTAGVINTIALKLSDAGVTSFTGAKIRGTLSGATGISSNPDFSAGLGIYTTSDPMTANDPMTDPPNLIYGNAFNAVPGPLPILGAGAAFGWSRRLRRRVSAAAGCATPRS